MSSSTRKFSTHDCTSSAVTCPALRILSASRCTACSSERSRYSASASKSDQSVAYSWSRAAAASLRPGLARWDCLLWSIRLRSWTALRMQAKASTMMSAACTPARKHACRTLKAVGSCGTAVLHAAALASKMRSDKGNGCARSSGAAAAAVDARTPPLCSSWSARWQCVNTAGP